jgi:hypothetical protein
MPVSFKFLLDEWWVRRATTDRRVTTDHPSTPDSARFGGLRQMEMLIRDSGLEVVRA